MPYYEFSSSDNYFLIHWNISSKSGVLAIGLSFEYSKSEFVLGFHLLSVNQQKSHIEFNVGLKNLGSGN